MDFRILGPVEVWADGQRFEMGPPKQRCVLAALLLASDSPVPAKRLIRNVWGDEPPAGARNDLYTYLSRLRSRLRPLSVGITSQSGGYRIDIDRKAVDYFRFSALRDQARSLVDSADDEAALPVYRRMAELWRGEPLSGIEGEWAENTRRNLEQDLLNGTEERFEVQLRLGRHADIVAELEELVERHPFREQLVGYLMRALYRSGRRGDALHAYDRTRHRLREELGIDPSPELKQLHQRILRGDPKLLPVPHRGVVRPAPRSNLPRDVAVLVGRESEVNELLKLASPTEPRGGRHGSGRRVIGVDGMVGTGKTVLAVHVAHILADQYPDGRFFIDLRGHNANHRPATAEAALDMLMRRVGLSYSRLPRDLEDQVALWNAETARRRMLIVLDDAAGHEQVRPLLTDAPGCLFLITSRRRLSGLDEIRSVPLDPLPSAEAAELFARAAGHRAPGKGEQRHVQDVVRLCGGLPMALQLVGNRLRHRPSWSVADLAERLAHDDNRLSEIRAENRAITVAFAGSYRSLLPDQQRAFRRLGLIVGEDFTSRIAAVAIDCAPGEASRLLDDLYDHHLLTELSRGRFKLHDLLREYARDRARKDDTEEERRGVVRRVIRHYLATASHAARVIDPVRRHLARDVSGPLPVTFDNAHQAAEWLSAELTNMQLALTQATAFGFKEEYCLIVAAISGHLESIGLWERSKQLNRKALSLWRELGERSGMAHAHAELALICFRSGQYGEAFEHAHEALAIFRDTADRRGEAEMLDQLGLIHWQQSRFADALTNLRMSLGIWRSMPDHRGEAVVRDHLSIVLDHVGDYRAAMDQRRRAIDIYTAIGDRQGLQKALNNAGHLQIKIGEVARARKYYEEAAAIYPELLSRQHQGILLNNMANVHMHTGRHEEALSGYREALLIYQEIGDRRSAIETLIGIGQTFERMGKYNEAIVHHERALALSRETLERYQEASALRGIGDALRKSHRHQAAADRYREALELAQQVGDPLLEARIHEGLGHTALAASARGNARRHWRRALKSYARLGLHAAAHRVRILLQGSGIDQAPHTL